MVSSSSAHGAMTGIDDVDFSMVPFYRRATAEQKLAVVGRLNAALIALKKAQLEAANQDWSAERIHQELRVWWLGADAR